jgi:hypothetical protein
MDCYEVQINMEAHFTALQLGESMIMPFKEHFVKSSKWAVPVMGHPT